MLLDFNIFWWPIYLEEVNFKFDSLDEIKIDAGKKLHVPFYRSSKDLLKHAQLCAK